MDTTTTLTASEVIDRVREARHDEHEACLRQVRLAVSWALLHPCPADEWPAHWGDPSLDEEVMPLAGEGAPWVAEFAPADLAAALDVSLDAARLLVGDSLELCYRLPRLWELTASGSVPVWRARAIARETRDLSVEAVAFADRLICATPSKVRLVDATKLVDEARLYYDPDRAVADEEHELTRRGVWIRHRGNPATTDVFMTLDTPDALLLDQTVSRIAGDLAALGDTDNLDIRRARAVGILADPQYALDLMSGRETAAPSRTGAMNLYVHFAPEDSGALIEKLGAATHQLLHDWLTQHTGRVIIRPVIDLADNATAVDRHDPPEAMREQVILRDAHCVFPGCRRDSRSCDLDHITPYISMSDGGPPGQTHPGNLAPLCRTHHRVKTFTTWHYKRLDDGTYTWTAPTGHQYDVTPVSRRPSERRAS